MCLVGGAYIRAMVHVWKPEGSSVEIILSSYLYVGSRELTWVVRFVWQVP